MQISYGSIKRSYEKNCQLFRCERDIAQNIVHAKYLTFIVHFEFFRAKVLAIRICKNRFSILSSKISCCVLADWADQQKMKVPSLKNVHFFLNIFFLFSGKPRDKKNRQKQYMVVPGFTDNWKVRPRIYGSPLLRLERVSMLEGCIRCCCESVKLCKGL